MAVREMEGALRRECSVPPCVLPPQEDVLGHDGDTLYGIGAAEGKF